jgi:hypothetical protein
LEALVEAGLVSRQSRQRLDSTAMFRRVARMNRLGCVRESLRLALQELEASAGPEARLVDWVAWWERYVESQVDYRANRETLGRKLGEAGQDAWQLLEWLRGSGQAQVRSGPQVQLLARVFAEQFEVVAVQPAPLAQEKTAVEIDVTAGGDPPLRLSRRMRVMRPERWRWNKSKRPWGWTSRRCNMSMGHISRRKSWCRCTLKAGN